MSKSVSPNREDKNTTDANPLPLSASKPHAKGLRCHLTDQLWLEKTFDIRVANRTPTLRSMSKIG